MDENLDEERGRALASELEAAGLALTADSRGLALTDGRLTLVADLADMLPRLAPGRLSHELLVKAAKMKGVANPVVFDATAGLGEDSLMLAAAGATVHLFEADPVICALLEDSLVRAREHPALAVAASRMHLHAGDSIAGMPALGIVPDVVYLDPMFPGRTKSAAVKKKFQLLHRLERPCANEGELLAAARAVGPKKIVVKRPIKGPWLAGAKPSHSISGKAVRYDCIVLPRP